MMRAYDPQNIKLANGIISCTGSNACAPREQAFAIAAQVVEKPERPN